MCKKYSVEAKRKHEKDFSIWCDTDNINRVIEYVDTIRAAGFEARVTAPGVELMEKKIADGYLVELPCRVGDTVYMPWEYKGVSGVAILTVTHVIIDKVHSYIRTDFESDSQEYKQAYNYGKFDFRDFGKKVFTKQDEAEKALEKLLAERSANDSITVT